MNLAIVSNPRRRKRRHSAKRRARRAAPRRRRHRAAAVPRRRRRHASRVLRIKRNPSRRRRGGGGMFGRQGGQAMTSLLLPGFMGAAGAIGFDYAYNKVSGYLPASLQGNYYVQAGIKLLAAVGIAKFGKKVVSPSTANAIAAGIAVVTLYDVAQIALGTMLTPAAPAPAAAGTSGRVAMSGRVALGYTGTGMSVNADNLPRSALSGATEMDSYGYGYQY